MLHSYYWWRRANGLAAKLSSVNPQTVIPRRFGALYAVANSNHHLGIVVHFRHSWNEIVLYCIWVKPQSFSAAMGGMHPLSSFHGIHVESSQAHYSCFSHCRVIGHALGMH